MATADRINMDSEFKELADRLVRRQLPESRSYTGVFKDNKELVSFAAALGYANGRRRAVEPSSQNREIKLSAVSRIGFAGEELIDALAVAATNDIAVLNSDREVERATIFEEYVNGGLELLQAEDLGDRDALDFINLIIKNQGAPTEDTDDVIDLLSQR